MSATVSSLSAELRQSAATGDLGEIRCLVLEGADVNDPGTSGYTALTHAARAGHVEIVAFLLREGARPDPHDDLVRFDSPLMVAAVAGHVGVVRRLIESGADPCRRVGEALAPAAYYAKISNQPAIGEYLMRVAAANARMQKPSGPKTPAE